jgi:hypothetical protein
MGSKQAEKEVGVEDQVDPATSDADSWAVEPAERVS